MGTMYGRIKLAIIILIISVALILIILTHINKNNTYAITEEAPVTEEMNKEMYVIAYCVVRDKPSAYGNKLCECNKGDIVSVESKLSTEWYKIKTSDNVGYVKCKYLEDTSEVFIDSDYNVIKSVESDGTIKYNDNIDESIVNYAYNFWYMIPSEIREDFINNGWKIELVDYSISDKYNIGYNVCGLTLQDAHDILIEANQSSIRTALIHEVGHYIDIEEGYISNNENFKILYSENKDSAMKYSENFNTETYNEQEYFAELFRVYISDGDMKYNRYTEYLYISSIVTSYMEKHNGN